MLSEIYEESVPHGPCCWCGEPIETWSWDGWTHINPNLGGCQPCQNGSKGEGHFAEPLLDGILRTRSEVQEP